MKKKSLRKRADELAGSGRLRDALERANVPSELIDYILDIIGRYCAPR